MKSDSTNLDDILLVQNPDPEPSCNILILFKKFLPFLRRRPYSRIMFSLRHHVIFSSLYPHNFFFVSPFHLVVSFLSLPFRYVFSFISFPFKFDFPMKLYSQVQQIGMRATQPFFANLVTSPPLLSLICGNPNIA